MAYPNTETYDIDTDTVAERVESHARIPCWHCGKLLCNKQGQASPPFVGYRVHIHRAPRVLHRSCVESLGVKIK